MALEGTATGATIGTAIAPGLGSIIGAGAGLVGDIFGGLFGSRSSKKQMKESRRQFDAQMDFQKNATQYRVQDALKAGINPLAALGVSSNVSPTVSSYGDSSTGEAFSRAGGRVQRFFENLAARDTVDDLRYKREVRALDLESRRIQNQMDKARLGIIGQPGVPSVETFPSEVGVDDGIINAMVRVRNRDGSISYYPSPAMADILDVEFSGGNPYAWQHVGENKFAPALGSTRDSSKRQMLLDWWYKHGRPTSYNRRTGEFYYE